MNKKNAFSMMELAVVILIVAILITGMIQGSRLVQKAKLETAKTITNGSPVASIKSLALWYETTSDKSFIDSQRVDEGPIDIWYDINPSTISSKSASSIGAARPSYIKNCINSLPCLRFDGNDYLDTQSLRINTTALSYFIVIKPSELPTSGQSTLIGTQGEYSGLNNSVQFRIKGGSDQGKFEFISANGAQDSISTSVLEVDKFYVISALDNSSNVKLFVNKASVGGPYSSPYAYKTLEVVNIGSANDGTVRGDYFIGDIGEIIVFDDEIKAVDRQYIEDYLLKKWNFRF